MRGSTWGFSLGCLFGKKGLASDEDTILDQNIFFYNRNVIMPNKEDNHNDGNEE